jgi:hypothetical protein
MNDQELIDAYRAAQANYENHWGYIDAALRRVVHPRELNTANAVYVSVVMIDSVYRTQLSRTFGRDDPVWHAAQAIYQQRERLVPLIERLSDHLGLSRTSLGDALAAHRTLLAVISECQERKAAVRSFASKYLHFAADWVPIYDSMTSGYLSDKHWRWRQFKAIEPELAQLGTAAGDETYRRYCIRFLALHERLGGLLAGELISVRLLDHMLWRLSASGAIRSSAMG